MSSFYVYETEANQKRGCVVREIKFRAWDKDECSMNRNVESGIYCDPDEVLEFHEVLGLARYEVMQYTGLKDKNGREIYEGDIITYEEGEYSFSAVIEYGDYEFYFEVVKPFEDSYQLHDWYESGKLDVEVIGNIYENPELLEVTN